MESSHGIDAALKGRRRYHFQVVARAKRDDLLLANKLRDPGEIGLDGLLQLIAARMLVRYFLQDFSDNQILAIVNTKLRMVVVPRVHLRVQRKRDLQHFGAHRFHVLFRVGQDLFRCHRRFHHQLEFLIVEFFA